MTIDQQVQAMVEARVGDLEQRLSALEARAGIIAGARGTRADAVEILRRVCDAYNVGIHQVRSGARHARLVEARRVASYVMDDQGVARCDIAWTLRRSQASVSTDIATVNDWSDDRARKVITTLKEIRR
jgi:hypothetical protein